MEKIPKIVTERLRAATVTAAHPDADLLTAFSEHSLPECERGPIVDHLARCSECREVVALALPAEDAAAAVIRPVRNPWLTWPRMRWAFVAAGVVAVASVGLLQYQRGSQPAAVAKLYDAAPKAATQQEQSQQSLPQPEAAKVEAKEESSASAAPAPASPAKKRRDEGRAAGYSYDSASSDKNVVSGGVVVGNTLRGQQLAHGPKAPVQFQQNMNSATNTSNEFDYRAKAAPAPAPLQSSQQASKQLVILPTTPPGSVGGPLNDKQVLDKVAVNGHDTFGLQASGAGASAGVGTGAEIARAKPAASANAPQAAPTSGAYSVDADRVSNFSPSGPLVAESAQWSIDSVGGLQRSMDQGRTWQDVDVNGPVGTANGMSLQMAMKSSRTKVLAKDKADAKVKPIVFRAVSANGPDVWAGGSEGNLYHSTDSGATWVRVVPSWRGIELTGDILNLQFSDPQHGRIVTAAAEIWTTSDAGQTWDKH